MIQLGAVAAVVLFSDAPEQLAAWYTRVLASSEIVRTEDFVGLHIGATNLFIQRTSEGHRPGMGGVRPHFQVAHCAAAFEALTAAGATTVLPVTDLGAELVAAVQDPHGNPLGLIQPKS